MTTSRTKRKTDKFEGAHFVALQSLLEGLGYSDDKVLTLMRRFKADCAALAKDTQGRDITLRIERTS